MLHADIHVSGWEQCDTKYCTKYYRRDIYVVIGFLHDNNDHAEVSPPLCFYVLHTTTTVPDEQDSPPSILLLIFCRDRME